MVDSSTQRQTSYDFYSFDHDLPTYAKTNQPTAKNEVKEASTITKFLGSSNSFTLPLKTMLPDFSFL